MKNVTFYFDDYRLIKAFSKKPFSTLGTFELYCGDEKVEYTIKNIDELEIELHLDKDMRYDHPYFIRYRDGFSYVILRKVLHTEHFDKDFMPNMDRLGSFIENEGCLFRFWAPLAEEVVLVLDKEEYTMEAKKKGVYETFVYGNQERKAYYFRVKRYGEYTKVIDPFAYSSGPNALYSYVLDPQYFVHDKYPLKSEIKNYVDAIIYEAHVRDFSSDPNFPSETHGLFNDLAKLNLTLEDEVIGLSYLKDLGITHLQLLPVTDYGSVDEIKKDRYNWGYDPMQYNVLEGTYASDLKDPYTRVNDFINLVNICHQNDIRVNLDVVFNHVYKWEEYSLGLALPYYPFRLRKDGSMANGSFCGNEVRSESAFMRAYILKMCKRYVELYDVDGLRFDLMGLIDIETIRLIKEEMTALKADFMVYGEGWDMGDVLPSLKRASMNNASFLKEVGFFNPHFRDVVKGPTMLHAIKEKGYVLGNLYLVEEIKNALTGDTKNNFFKNPNQSVNYVECHDNMTFYDKMSLSNMEEDDRLYRKRAKLAIGLTLLAQGIPFIHAGQEFLRTKMGVENSYNASDKINMIDWARKEEYSDVVEFTKDMIQIRKNYPSFRKTTTESILKDVRFEHYYEVLVYNVDDLKVLINPCPFKHLYNINGQYRMIYNADEFDDVVISKCVGIPEYSIVILEKVKN